MTVAMYTPLPNPYLTTVQRRSYSPNSPAVSAPFPTSLPSFLPPQPTPPPSLYALLPRRPSLPKSSPSPLPLHPSPPAPFSSTSAPAPAAASSLPPPSSASVDPTPLLQRIDALTAENAQLKRSVFELSYQYNKTMASLRSAYPAHSPALGVFELAPQSKASGDRRERKRAGDGDRRPDARAGQKEADADDDEDASQLHIERVLSSSSSSSAHAGGGATSASSARLFSKKTDLLGHSSAVYALTFSGDGRLLASGGMDKSVRVWDAHGLLSSVVGGGVGAGAAGSGGAGAGSSRYELLNLSAHALNVSSLAFASPSSSSAALLVSASFDKTVAFHDVNAGSTLLSVDVAAFATSVAPSPSSPHLCYVGTTGKRVVTVDRRAGAVVTAWDNDSMVSAVDAGEAEDEVMSGDHGGCIKRWSARTGRCLLVQHNDPQHAPISDLHSLSPHPHRPPPFRPSSRSHDTDGDHAQPSLVAVNSFDDTVRVYEAAAAAARSGKGGREREEARDELRLVQELKGVKGQNWPIRSAFYRGKEWHEREEWRGLNDALSSSSSEVSSPPSSPASPASSPSSSASDDSPPSPQPLTQRVVDVTQREWPLRGRRRRASALAHSGPFSLAHSILLASGSADGVVSVWDVTGDRGKGGKGAAATGGGGGGSSGRLLQRLEGHKDRVYTVAFHPVEPVLVSAGVDAAIKVWTAKP